MLSAQGATASWWAGTHSARVAGGELGIAEIRRGTPDSYNKVMAAERQIAVLESRLKDVFRQLYPIGAALDRMSRAE